MYRDDVSSSNNNNNIINNNYSGVFTHHKVQREGERQLPRPSSQLNIFKTLNLSNLKQQE